MTARLLVVEGIESVARALANERTELHAGGTDLVERLHRGKDAPQTVVHLARSVDTEPLTGVSVDARGDLVVGAATTLASLAADGLVERRHPMLAEAARATATPQIRARATVGGALFQHVRCWYARHPTLSCLRTGGTSCLAKDGENDHHAIFGEGPCVAVHPSTLAAALIALDASLVVQVPDVSAPQTVSIADVFAIDPSRADVDHTLPRGAVVTGVVVPVAQVIRAERYLRASARALADWASVEVAVVVERVGGKISHARVVLGAVARTPLASIEAERALVGQRLDDATIARAAKAATKGARPLSKNAYKVALVEGTVRAALEEIRDAR